MRRAPMLLLVVLAGTACRDHYEKPGTAETTGATAESRKVEGQKVEDLTLKGGARPLEVVARFDGAMPTGVTVSRSGRIFVNFPRWGDDVQYTVAELKDGVTQPYPNAELNKVPPRDHLDRGFVSVQSVVVDPNDRLWVLDTGSIKMMPTELGGPKLVAVDLKKNAIVKTIVLPRDVALPTTYLNDIRFDLTRGKKGMAFITDSAGEGPNGIIVVDLDSGKSWRRLRNHPSTKADPSFKPMVEGRVVEQREPGKPTKPLSMGSDGIAISPDGKTLYYTPLVSRHLYSVAIDALANEKTPDSDVDASVKDLGDKGGASDGLESDADGGVYLTDYEHNRIVRRDLMGKMETLVEDPRALWPDTMSLAHDGYLYFTANQLHRQPQYNDGNDLRQKPYWLFKVKVDGKPVALRK